MRLKGRENAATVKTVWHIAEGAAVPRRGTAVLGEEPCGVGCGVQGEGRGRGIVCLTLRDTAVVWRGLCPCLNPLGSTGKRPGGPERSGAALRPFNLFDFCWTGTAGSFTLLCLLALSSGRIGNRAIGDKNRGFVPGLGW
jgi:hypothetical protein